MTKFNFSDIIFNLANQLSPELVLKFFILALAFFYLFFAFALLRQVQLMAKVVEVKVSPIINILGILHFLSAVFLFLFGILIL